MDSNMKEDTRCVNVVCCGNHPSIRLPRKGQNKTRHEPLSNHFLVSCLGMQSSGNRWILIRINLVFALESVVKRKRKRNMYARLTGLNSKKKSKIFKRINWLLALSLSFDTIIYF